MTKDATSASAYVAYACAPVNTSLNRSDENGKYLAAKNQNDNQIGSHISPFGFHAGSLSSGWSN